MRYFSINIINKARFAQVGIFSTLCNSFPEKCLLIKMLEIEKMKHNTKAELQQVGIFFRTQFPSLGFFINKKVGNRKKLRPPSIQL